MDGYSNRELDEKFNGLHDKLDMIHDQVKTTNGRVRALEKWRSFITGGLTVLSIIVVPILLFVITSLIK